MDNITYLDPRQQSLIESLQDTLHAAKKGEISDILVTFHSKDQGQVFYTSQDVDLAYLLGNLEIIKAFLLDDARYED